MLTGNERYYQRPRPEPKPLMTVICIGDFRDIILVQLFSNPQQIHASITYKEPTENCKLSRLSTDNNILERVMSPAASHNFLELEMIRWWLDNGMKQTPEELTEYYISVIFPLLASSNELF